jgi:hypothetical protein
MGDGSRVKAPLRFTAGARSEVENSASRIASIAALGIALAMALTAAALGYFHVHPGWIAVVVLIEAGAIITYLRAFGMVTANTQLGFAMVMLNNISDATEL